MRSLLLIALATRAAAADPALGRVVTSPTAWLPEAGAAIGSAALDHRGDGAIVVGYGLGGIASVELGEDSEVRRCADVCAPVRQGRAAFRIGARQDAWFAGQPALAFGVSESFGGSTAVRDGATYVVASRSLGPLVAHGGVEAFDARASAAGARLGTTVRPLAGLELIPPQYPKTTLMADIAWLPLARAATDDVQLEWLIGWGVRYQALSWGSIELDVRHRENEGLAASTVFVRVNGVWSHPL
jgi:hypothetical protein